LASHGSAFTWRLRRGATEGRYDALDAAHRTIPSAQDALWEWIVDDTGEVFHVDRKQLEVPLLEQIPRAGPPARWTLGRQQGMPSVHLRDTSISGLSMLAGLAGTVCIGCGSPLAHLCSEAVGRGWAVILEL
jgi:hypothetical protein